MKNIKKNKNTKNLINKALVLTTAVSAAYLGGLVSTSDVLADTQYSTVDYLNLRQGPGIDQNILLVIPANENVQLMESMDNGWAKVIWKGHTGYVSKDYLKKTETITQSTSSSLAPISSEKTSLRSDGYYMYTTDFVNMRSEASITSSVMRVLSPGSDLQIINKVSDFYQVQFNGEYGFVSSAFLSDYSALNHSSVSAPTTVVDTVVASSKAVSTDLNIKMKTTDYLNFRDGASTSSNVLSVISPGEVVTVHDNAGEFYRVSYNGKSGYVSGKYLTSSTTSVTPTPVAAAANPAPTKSEHVMITTDYLNFRSGGSLSSSIMSVIPAGEKVNVLDASGSFYKVSYNGIIGYVSSTYLKEASVSSASNPATPVVTAPVVSTVSDDYMITNDYLNLRKSDSTDSEILTTVYSGVKVRILSRNTNGWFKVEYNSMTGYMYSKYLSSLPSENKTKDPIVGIKTATLKEDSYLKAGPNNDFWNLGYLVKGTNVTVLDDSGYFVKVAFGDKVGYILDNYLEVSSTSVTAPSVTKPTVTESVIKKMLTTDYLNLRSGAGTNNPVISVLNPSTTVDVLSESNGWSKVTVNGSTGFVSSTYLSDPKTAIAPTTPVSNSDINSSTSTNTVDLGKVTTIYSGSVQLTGRETVSSQISVYGVPNSIGNVSFDVSATTTLPSVSAVYIYVNNFLQGKATYSGGGYYYHIAKNITKPGNNNVTFKVISNGVEYISSKTVNIDKKPLVVIDPGHGGPEPGAIGTDIYGNQYKESIYTFKISKYLKASLESYGFQVILTRDGDYNLELQDRAYVANKNDADFFISVHHNAALSRFANGAWTGYPGYKYNPVSQGAYTESALIAKLLEEAYANAGLANTSPTRDQDYTGYTYSVNRNSNMKSVLTEVGFITNIMDLEKITNDGFQAKVASEMAKAIYRYFYNKY